MGHTGANRKSSNDAPWETLSQKLCKLVYAYPWHWSLCVRPGWRSCQGKHYALFVSRCRSMVWLRPSYLTSPGCAAPLRGYLFIFCHTGWGRVGSRPRRPGIEPGSRRGLTRYIRSSTELLSLVLCLFLVDISFGLRFLAVQASQLLTCCLSVDC